MTAPLRDKRPAKDDPTIAERLRSHRMLSAVPQAELDWLIERGTLGYDLPGDRGGEQGRAGEHALLHSQRARGATWRTSVAPGAR